MFQFLTEIFSKYNNPFLYQISILLVYQLRNVYRKLESDLQGSKKRMAELVEQCNALKKGREDSVSILIRTSYTSVSAYTRTATLTSK